MIEKREKSGLKNDPTAFIEHSSTMDDTFEDIEDYNKKRKRKVLIVFDDMISHVMSNKKAQKVLKELYKTGQKNLTIFLLLILDGLLIKDLKRILLILYKKLLLINKSKFLIIKLGQIKLNMI